MESKEQQDLNSWDGFIGSQFLKADHVRDSNHAFIVKGAEISEDMRPRLTVESENKTFYFDLNVSNSNFLQNSGIAKPNAVVGKRLYFKKVLVRNPKTNQEVEGLRISKVE